MMHEIALIVAAVVIAGIVIAVSPVARAICWDSIVHPRYQCLWEKRGSEIRELHARLGKTRED
jgi:hypothetical protein